MKNITWKTYVKPLTWLKPTPINYKLAVDDGSERLNQSMKKFGFAGSLIANLDGTIINGNSRKAKLLKEGNKTCEVSLPSRKLTPKETQGFAAIFDFARAGEVDLASIKKDFGTTKGFLEMYGLDMPAAAVKNLQELEKAKINSNAKRSSKAKAEVIVSKPLTLVFTASEHAEFIAIAESLYSTFKCDNITDFLMKLVKQAKKTYRK